MNITPPPELQRRHIDFHNELDPPYSYHLVRGIIEDINKAVNDAGFENRYLPKIQWFENQVQTKSILNIGCGRRESFALLWFLGADNVIGLDNNSEKIEYATRLVRVISALVNDHIPQLQSDIKNIICQQLPQIFSEGPIGIFTLENTSSFYSEYLGKFKSWSEDIPGVISEMRVPEFHRMNITENLDFPNQFDLIYGRCVLYLIMNNKEDIDSAVRNIAGLLKPDTGRLVTVEPTIFEGRDYNIPCLFKDIGLKLITECDNDHELGGNEINELENKNVSELKGSIFYKPV